jgi:pilus assembly protein CpaC
MSPSDSLIPTLHRKGRLAAALLAALPLVFTPLAAAQTPPGSGEISIVAGKSSTIETTEDVKDIMVADPSIADVLPLTSRSVYVVGKKMGATALSIYGPNKRLLFTASIVVSADGDTLRARLRDILPNETDIAVRSANQSIVLSGVVSSPVALRTATSLAESFAPEKVVNLLGVEGTQQVMLSVRMVEMEKTVAKDLRINVERDPARLSVVTGDSLLGNINVLEKTFGQIMYRIANRDGDINLLFDAMEQKGLVKTLAEPNLVAMSGDTASFLAGGEFPIPVQQSGGSNGTAATITVEYKQFGVSLAFTPTILQDGLINLVVNPEVSSIDPTTSVDLGAIKIPGIKVRRVNTTVELRDGESFTIAGLLRDDYQSQIEQFPFLGDIPVLGALFRSNGYKHKETELVIVVTPHLVVPHRGSSATPADTFAPPSDLELFLFGRQEARDGLRPEDRVLLSGDSSKSGIDGPHGHILN